MNFMPARACNFWMIIGTAPGVWEFSKHVAIYTDENSKTNFLKFGNKIGVKMLILMGINHVPE